MLYFAGTLAQTVIGNLATAVCDENVFDSEDELIQNAAVVVNIGVRTFETGIDFIQFGDCRNWCLDQYNAGNINALFGIEYGENIEGGFSGFCTCINAIFEDRSVTELSDANDNTFFMSLCNPLIGDSFEFQTLTPF